MEKGLRYLLVFILFYSFFFPATTAQYVVNGDARRSGNCFTLTEDRLWQSGSVWYWDKVKLAEKFEVYLDVFFGCKDGDGADGLAFVLQQVSTSIGSQGGGIGYLGIQPSLAIEFDTWQNATASDPSNDHVAIMQDGDVSHSSPNNLSGPTSILAGSSNAEDCAWHELKITWDPDLQRLRVFVDCNLRLNYSGDIINNVFNGDSEVFWGVTSATGGFANRHEFCLDYISFVEQLNDTAVCKGQSVRLNVGTGDSFRWTPSSGLSSDTVANPVATPDSTTTYFVEVTNNCGDPRYDQVTIYVQDSLDDALNDDYRLCPDGEVAIVPDYPFASFQWPNGLVSDTFIVDQEGTYTVQVTNLCSTFEDTFNVLPPLFPTLEVRDITCQGQNDGSASLILPSPSSNVIFWTNSQGNPIRITSPGNSRDSLNFLAEGEYYYVTQDSAGCVLADSFVIEEPPALLIGNPVVQNISCGGQQSGQISLQPQGGVTPYQYSINGGNFQAGSTFSNLGAGTYVIIVRDSNLCEESLTLTLTENPPIQPSLNFTRDNACFGEDQGVIDVSASGGIGPLEYSLDQINFQPTGNFSQLTAAAYLLTVRDSLGCRAALNVSIQEPALLLGGTTNQRNVDCFGDSTASIELTAQGGSPAYSYSFNNGTFGNVVSYSGLSAGAYPFEVRDDSGCVARDTVVISQPSLLQAQLDQVVNVACFGDSSASISLSGVGGSAPYAYNLNSGNYQSDSIFSGLPVGLYNLTVRDDSNCVASLSLLVSQPPSLLAEVSNIRDVDCLGNQSGGLTITAGGGTAPYMYAVVNSGNVSTGFRSTTVFDSLYAGLYTAQVMDANGCAAEVDTSISTPTSLTGGIDSLTDVDCFGASTGSILMTARGGTAPYEYSFDGTNFSPGPLFDGLGRMRDTVILQDANGCIIPIPFVIDEPDSLSLLVSSVVDVACFGGQTGKVFLQGVGGALPYNFSLNSQSQNTDSIFTGLSFGPYTFELEDRNGCFATASAFVDQPDSLELLVDTLLPVVCFGEKNGVIDVSAQGGAGGYSYSFDSASYAIQSRFDSLSAGTYLITVQDDSACISSQVIEVVQPDSLMLQIDSSLDILCFGDSTGEVLLEVRGGNLPYNFFMNNGNPQLSGFYDSLPSGNYEFVVLDDKGCMDSTEIVLTEPEELNLELAMLENVDCFGNDNGEVLLLASGGVEPYEFVMNALQPSSQPAFDSLPAGTYSFVLIDSNACEAGIDSLEITQPDSLLVDLQASDVLCYGESSGQLSALVEGGTQPYDYNWRENEQLEFPDYPDVPIGLYGIQVVDSNGCEAFDEALIQQPDTLLLALDSLQEAYCDLANGYARVMASGGLGSYSYSWEGSNMYEGHVQDGIEGGNFLVSVIDENGCLDTLSVSVPQDPPATPFFITSPPIEGPILLSEARELAFVNQSENAVSYIWDMDAPMGIFNTEDVTFTYTEKGTYVVRLTAYNKYFVCPVDYTDTLEIIPDGNLQLANAFTPNEDGINDEYFVVGEGVVDFTFIIFNRWGKEVARFNSLTDRWDGTNLRGIPQPEGVYAYRMRAILNSGEEVDRAGTITLIR